MLQCFLDYCREEWEMPGRIDGLLIDGEQHPDSKKLKWHGLRLYSLCNYSFRWYDFSRHFWMWRRFALMEQNFCKCIKYARKELQIWGRKLWCHTFNCFSFLPCMEKGKYLCHLARYIVKDSASSHCECVWESMPFMRFCF